MSGEVISIDDLRIQRLHSGRFFGSTDCEHKTIAMDGHGQVVTCSDCGVRVEPYWALDMVLTRWRRMRDSLQREAGRIKEEKDKHVHLIAARAWEAAWRRRDQLPICPHCHRGILPQPPTGTVHRKFEEAASLRAPSPAPEPER